ncbi:MAG: hypothetical protein V4582_13535 [Pseudomonadota bacterium]
MRQPRALVARGPQSFHFERQDVTIIDSKSINPGGGVAEHFIHTNTELEVAAEAAELARAGACGREAAALLLYRRLGRRITRYLERHRVSEADAEEMLGDIIYKFIMSEVTGTGQCSAIAFLWTIVERVLIDWVRRRDALCRGAGETEVLVDEATWLRLIETTVGQFSVPDWVKDCVQRAAALFQHEKPRQAELLLLYAQGHSHRELAIIILGADPENVTDHQEKAAKSRVHHACKLAREYFKNCLE